MRKDFRTKKRNTKNSNKSNDADNAFSNKSKIRNMPKRDDRRNNNKFRRTSTNRNDNRNNNINSSNRTKRYASKLTPKADFGFNEYRLKGIYSSKNKKGLSFYTKNILPGEIVYDEKLIQFNNIEYREWNPKKSKLGAAIYNGCSQIGIKPGSTILYLGCSTGTTCSHVSDIIGENGFLFGLDVAPRVMREFVFLCEKRKNMAPLLKDAHQPIQYSNVVPKVDVVFQDIAQRDQVNIFLKNCKTFLKDNGTAMIAVKARSIDVTKKPKDIFEDVRKVLEKEMIITDSRSLEPYEKDHYFFVVKHKK